MSLYEQSREERIKENLQRMQKLGIFDLSKKLNSAVSPKRTPKHSRANSQRSTPVLTPGPLRRSSRLQNATPISYSEAVLSKKYKGLEDNTDGRQIYDPVNGKTCHQCRNKTLGHHTQCSECNRIRGQFCEDCLYTRYGEHVLEALENPNWICPVCRGICNCSLCRKAKGLCPTGALYKKISKLGFKSVAHYLIQTQRAQTTLEKSPDTVNQVSAKRSLSFSDSEALLKDSPKANENELVPIKPRSDDRKDDKDLNTEKENSMQGGSHTSTNHQTSAKRSLPFSNIEAESKNVDSTEVDLKVQNHFGLSKPQLEAEEEKKLHQLGNDSDIALQCCPKSQKKRAASEPKPDSTAGRLSQRRRKGNDHDDMELTLVNEKSLDVKQSLSNILSDKEKEILTNGTPKLMSKPAVDTELDHNCEAGRSRQVEMEEELKVNHASPKNPGPNSIAGRLRSRNKTT